MRPPARRRRTLLLTLVGVVTATLLTGCASEGIEIAPHPPTPASIAPPAPGVVRPEPHARFDYQIGGAYAPPPGVRVLSRDRTARPEPGRYNICYINAFQVQPDALDRWQREHPDLLLRDGGTIVMDTEWNEALLDISTDAKRTALAAIVGDWIDECARSGFQAVEPDNFESYTRSHRLLTPADDIAFARLLAARAHAAHLAIAQKNGAELIDRGTDIGFDFAVAEECGRYDECGAYASAYANRVFVVEYAKPHFTATCRVWGGTLSVVLRDRNVTPAGNREYRYETC